ncbi:hypothetical protein [Caballeronia udeis]|uniref:hypothetical protein n=1 Tax=Caballeronia udeis TaxID=1232866 RepID=UPI0018D365AF|nr:hypothetical protein [Caballeronia udeis]
MGTEITPAVTTLPVSSTSHETCACAGDATSAESTSKSMAMAYRRRCVRERDPSENFREEVGIA